MTSYMSLCVCVLNNHALSDHETPNLAMVVSACASLDLSSNLIIGCLLAHGVFI